MKAIYKSIYDLAWHLLANYDFCKMPILLSKRQFLKNHIFALKRSIPKLMPFSKSSGCTLRKKCKKAIFNDPLISIISVAKEQIRHCVMSSEAF